MGIMVLSALVVTAYAAVPKTINYQGYLTDSSGAPITGSASIEFSLYTAPTGTASNVWTENQSVTVNNGVFNAVLGSVISLNTVTFDVPYFIGVKVGTDAEMTPRQAVSSSAYAITADTAFKLSCTGCVTNGMIADSTISEAKLAPTGTLVTNLNADLLDGSHATAFAASSHVHAGAEITSGTVADARLTTNVATLSGIQTFSGAKTFSSQIASSVATGTAPLSVASTTKVTNLNADYLDGYTAGNASGNIPISNGTVNTNLNADLLDGMNSATAGTASTIAARDTSGNLTSADFIYSSAKSGAIFADPAECVIGDSGVDPDLNLYVVNPPVNYYSPSMRIAIPAASTTYNMYCPVHIQIPPGAAFTLTGGSLAFYDGSANCLVGAEIRTKTFGTSSIGTVLSSAWSGTSSTDYASIPGGPTTSAFTAISSAINDSTIVWINGIIGWSSTTTGACFYSGVRLTYTVSKP